MKRLTLITMLAAALGVLAPAQPAQAFQDQTSSVGLGLKIGQKAPDFTLKTMDGEEISLSIFLGKRVVVLDFWATWCNICKSELPTMIKEDYNPFKDKGLEILGITLQSGDDEEIHDVVAEYKVPWPILIDEKLVVATKLYRLAGPIPLKVVIDGKGIVRYAHVGDYPPGENEMPDVIRDLLTELPPDALQWKPPYSKPEAAGK